MGHRWKTFAGWHREPLYREVYARTAATLIAAFVIYLVAAALGLVERHQAVVLSAMAFLLAAIWVAGHHLTVPRYSRGSATTVDDQAEEHRDDD